eukprot:4770238-Pyramimonas_sp.AAC.2
MGLRRVGNTSPKSVEEMKLVTSLASGCNIHSGFTVHIVDIVRDATIADTIGRHSTAFKAKIRVYGSAARGYAYFCHSELREVIHKRGATTACTMSNVDRADHLPKNTSSKVRAKVSNRQYWLDICPHLHISTDREPPSPLQVTTAQAESLRKRLSKDGYFDLNLPEVGGQAGPLKLG